ncbi:hypothetical protein VTK73DRAFT_9066 [Phialemonium thermophilum]|uniref:Uncharacterized protein n=1 Tax=Phialemonium thermophilum TaxID=223376 RepID=A0ABR3W4Q8_9PEZI
MSHSQFRSYDYWQNQPGNYRKPGGLARRPYFRAAEIINHWVGGLESRACHPPRAPARARAALRATIRFPLLRSPERCRALRNAAPRRPRRGPVPRRFRYSASPTERYPLRLRIGLAICQSPTDSLPSGSCEDESYSASQAPRSRGHQHFGGPRSREMGGQYSRASATTHLRRRTVIPLPVLAGCDMGQ